MVYDKVCSKEVLDVAWNQGYADWPSWRDRPILQTARGWRTTMSPLPMSFAPGAARSPRAIRLRSPRANLPAVAWVAFLIAGVAVISLAAQSGSAVERLLTERMGFSAADLRALDGGLAVITSLDTRARQELAHVGVVYIDAQPGDFVERFRDIERFESGPGILQIGRFDNPPRLEDLQALTLPDTDVTALSQCRPGNCDVKLSADAMRHFRNEVDWSSATAAGQANQIARKMIFELVLAYQADGNAALGSYVDGAEPLPVAEQFRALLGSEDPLPTPVPALLAYLDDYPRGRPPGAEDFFYWTVVDFGLKPTIRVNHVTIYPLASSPLAGEAYAVAIKQLYASHYFHTTLELRFLAGHARRSGRCGASLISITRSRNDGMTGFKGWFLRPVISRRSRDAVRGYLEHVQRQMERPVPAAFAIATKPTPPVEDRNR